MRVDFKYKLYLIDDEYSGYLRKIESQVPYTDYGYYSIKPFLKAFETQDDLAYMVPITSYKDKFVKFQEKEMMYFIKHPFTDEYLGCLRFGKMFPVPLECIQEIDLDHLEKYRGFTTALNQIEFEHRLKLTNYKIDKLDIEYMAKELYKTKQKDENIVAFNYQTLERIAITYKEHLYALEKEKSELEI